MTPFSRSNSSRSKRAVGENIGENIQRQAGIGGQHMGIIRGLLDASRGIEIAARGFDFLGDGMRRTPPRAFEGHVLEKVR